MPCIGAPASSPAEPCAESSAGFTTKPQQCSLELPGAAAGAEMGAMGAPSSAHGAQGSPAGHWAACWAHWGWDGVGVGTHGGWKVPRGRVPSGCEHSCCALCPHCSLTTWSPGCCEPAVPRRWWCENLSVRSGSVCANVFPACRNPTATSGGRGVTKGLWKGLWVQSCRWRPPKAAPVVIWGGSEWLGFTGFLGAPCYERCSSSWPFSL